MKNQVINKSITAFTHRDNKLSLCVNDQINNPGS